MNEEERYKAVAACRWVDEVVKDAPYVTSLEWMDRHNCEWCLHGDDIVLSADGTDTYHEVKKVGRFKTVPRTQGVSTTDLVGRMLLLQRPAEGQAPGADLVRSYSAQQQTTTARSPYTAGLLSRFVPTTGAIVDFSAGRRPRTASDKVVLIDGGFDLFHVGHIDILQQARAEGSYLVVGVYDDSTVARIKGAAFPIQGLYERVLSVLQCRYVDEVVMASPYVHTEEMLKTLNVSLVVSGTTNEGTVMEGVDPYAVAKRLGIYRQLNSPSSLTTKEIVARILANRIRYEERNRKKEAKELASLAST
jgi:ethanolamine-phosphate cytidylyltransferase